MRSDTTRRVDHAASRRIVRARLGMRITRALAFVIGLLVLAIAALYHGVLRDPKRMGALVEARLQDALGRLDVAAGDVDLRPLEGFAQVRALALGAPGSDQSLAVARCPAVEVRFSPGSPFAIREVRLVEPEVDLVRAADGTWNAARLFPTGGGAGSGAAPTAGPAEPSTEPSPIVHVDRGRIRVRDARFLAEGRAFEVGPLSVRADPTGAPGVYALTGTVAAPGLGLARLTGRLAANEGALELALAGVEPCSIDGLAKLADVLAPEWAAYVRRAGPVAGEVSWTASLAWAGGRLVDGDVELVPMDVALAPEVAPGETERVTVRAGRLGWTLAGGVATRAPLELEALGARWRLAVLDHAALLTPEAGAHVSIDSVLAQRLERASGLPLESRWELRGSLVPSGRAAWPEGGPWRVELAIADGTLGCAGVVPPWRGLAGALSYAGTGELAAHLAGALGAGTLAVRVAGTSSGGANDGLELDVEARTLDLGPAMRPPLGATLADALARLELAGTADVTSRLVWRGGALASHAHAIAVTGLTAVVAGERIALARGAIDYDGAVARVRDLELAVGGGTRDRPEGERVAVAQGEVHLERDQLRVRALELALLGGKVLVREATIARADDPPRAVRAEVQVADLDLARVAALPWIPEEWEERVRPLAPRGRLAGRIAVVGTVDDLEVTGALELAQVQLAAPGITEAVLIPVARLALLPGSVEVVQCEIALGATRATVRGTTTLGEDPTGTAVVAFDPLVLGERWQYELGGADVVRYVGELRPEGRSCGTVRVAFGGPAGVRLMGGEATLYGAAMQLLEYDQRLDDIAGTVEIPAGGPDADGSVALHLRDASGRIGGRSFAGQGVIRVGGRAKLGLDLSFWCAAVPASEWIRLGLDRDMGEAYQEFEVQGTIDLRVDVLRRAGDRVLARIVLEATGGITMRFVDFPLRLEAVRGRLEISRGGIFIQQMRGRAGDAVVTASGTIRAGRPHNRIDLVIHAQGAHFDAALRAALPDEYREIWDLLEPSGEFALDLSLARSDVAQRKLHHRLAIFPRAVRLAPFGHPIPGVLTSGQVLVNPRRVDAVGVVSRIGTDGRLGLDGTLWVLEPHAERVGTRLDPDGVAPEGAPERAELRYRCRATAMNVPVDPELLEALRGFEPAIAGKLEPSGKLTAVALAVDGHRGPTGTTIAYDGALAFDGVALAPALRATALQGELELAGRRYGDAHLARGRLRNLSARVLGGPLEDAAADVVLAGGYLSFEPIRARFAGGALAGRLRIDTSPARAFQLAAHLADADLSRLALGQAEGDPVSGTLTGGFELAGLVGDPARLAGRGHFVVKDGMLWRLPPFMRLLDLFDLKQPGAFDAGELGIALSHGRFRLDPIAFSGPALALVGAGELDLEGRIEATLTTTLAPATIPQLPIVSRLWRELKRNVVPVRVGGTLGEPTVGFGPIPLPASQR